MPSPESFQEPGDTLGRVILIGGGGCLLAVLLIGLLGTWGTCAAGRSALEHVEAGQLELAAPAQAFLDATGRGDWDAAWDMTSPALQQRVTRHAFQGWLQHNPDLFVGGTARFQQETRGPGPGRRRLTVQIERGSTRVGVATFTLLRPPGGRGAAAGYLIDDLHGGIPQQDTDATTLLAARLQSHLRHMADGDHAAAADDFEPEGAARQGFLLFARAEAPRFQNAAPRLGEPDIQGDRARVHVVLLDAQTHTPRPGELIYDLRRDPEGRWWLTGVQIQSELPL